jgi:hypothetical protein
MIFYTGKSLNGHFRQERMTKRRHSDKDKRYYQHLDRVINRRIFPKG